VIVDGLGDCRPREGDRQGVRRVGDREAVRPRPGDVGGPERRGAPRVRRAPGVPDRPLPGQGDGPEHPRVPVRERDLRAGLEPQLHRPHPDHGGRVDRRRGPRAASTRRPARCATSSRTTCCRC
jgi:hypothetical protein